jgi:3-deoxy-7-phosphoheptulonate synthase
MVEVHHQPDRAWSDGEQALRPETFADLVTRIRHVAAAIGREV